VPTSTEIRIPTQTFLLPGQEFCIGLPWERADLPKHGVIASPKPTRARVTLRGDGTTNDPVTGWELGACTVLRRLSDGAARTLLAIRRDERGSHLVVMRKLELPEVFAREVSTHAEWGERFEHPGLVRVFPSEFSDEGVFWVTELPSGATLVELTAMTKKSGQSVPVGLALGAVLDVARALSELHVQGAAHGLVSDQSVAVGFDGAGRLLDTGLFRSIGQGPSWLELREAMAPYFAPEQLLGGRLPDPKTDVYSLGAVLYECLTGERVRRAQNFDQHLKLASQTTFVPASRLNMTVNAALDAVITKALSVARAQRYPNAREFAAALAAAAPEFTWRRELRANFVEKHFTARKKEDAALREGLAQLPPPLLRTETPPEPIDIEPELPPMLSRPIRAPQKKATLIHFRAPKKKSSPLPAMVALAAGLVLGFGLVTLEPRQPPAPPPPPLVWLDDVSTEAVQVEVSELTNCANEMSEAEAPALAPPQMPVVAAPKVRRVSRRKVDEAPLPPWLAKKSRR
jgi:serine/threonine-protein kinase